MGKCVARGHNMLRGAGAYLEEGLELGEDLLVGHGGGAQRGVGLQDTLDALGGHLGLL